MLRLSAIGDCCHVVPVVRAIQRAWPKTEINWVIGRTEHQLLRGLDGVEFLVLDKSAGLRGHLDLYQKLRGRHYPLLLHMHASARANVVSLMVAAQARLGFDRKRARNFQWLFTAHRIPSIAGQHAMEGLLEFARTLGIPTEPLYWDIPIDDQDRELAARLIEPATPVVVISPCTGQRLRNYRNWRAECYARIVDYAFSRYGARTVLTGAATRLENAYGAAITRHATHEPANLIGRTSLKQLLAIIQRATVLVCPDSGPAHMATAVGTPVVGLYATSNRLRTGPYLSQHLVVDRYPDAVRREHGRSPEELRWGQRVRNPDAMNLITVDDVVEKLDLAFAEEGFTPVNT